MECVTELFPLFLFDPVASFDGCLGEKSLYLITMFQLILALEFDFL